MGQSVSLRCMCAYGASTMKPTKLFGTACPASACHFYSFGVCTCLAAVAFANCDKAMGHQDEEEDFKAGPRKDGSQTCRAGLQDGVQGGTPTSVPCMYS